MGRNRRNKKVKKITKISLDSNSYFQEYENITNSSEEKPEIKDSNLYEDFQIQQALCLSQKEFEDSQEEEVERLIVKLNYIELNDKRRDDDETLKKEDRLKELKQLLNGVDDIDIKNSIKDMINSINSKKTCFEDKYTEKNQFIEGVDNIENTINFSNLEEDYDYEEDDDFYGESEPA